MSLLDFRNSSIGFALRASGDVYGAIVLVEDLAQLLANAYVFVSTLSWALSRELSDLPA